MKHLSLALICSLASFSFSARAETLELLLNNQTTLTISPVEYQGLPVSPNYAASLCSLLSFSRLVSVKTKDVPVRRGDLYAIVDGGHVGAYFLSTKSYVDSMTAKVLSEVVCAR